LSKEAGVIMGAYEKHALVKIKDKMQTL